jgi:hypothetical protein
MQAQEQYCHFTGGVAEISVHLEIWFSTQSDCVHDSFINSENPSQPKPEILDSFPCPTEESNGDIIKHIYVQ